MKFPPSHSRSFQLLLLVSVSLTLSSCGGWWRRAESRAPVADSGPSPAPPVAARPGATRAIILELEEKIRGNPEDFVAYNKLSTYYLQLQREVDDDALLVKAEQAARSSLDILPAEQNTGALAALIEVEKATHRFAEARAHAERYVELQPAKIYPRTLLYDALFELGEYDKAAQVLNRLEKMAGPDDLNVRARRARLAFINGRVEESREHFERALALIGAQNPLSGEGEAWHRWQLGETYFAAGDYESAERLYRQALAAHPDHRGMLASLARARAARGDSAEAIRLFEGIVRTAPHPEFAAPLGDLYRLAGREREAAAQYALVEEARASAHDNRALALFYADHDLRPEEAYQRARKEYELRRDIYTADAVAWAALKAGKLAEAQSAITEATRLGTKDAKLLYHAGMIARAAGDKARAADYLKRALDLNPNFDLLQAPVARKALAE